jgi:hypothetical protein
MTASGLISSEADYQVPPNSQIGNGSSKASGEPCRFIHSVLSSQFTQTSHHPHDSVPGPDSKPSSSPPSTTPRSSPSSISSLSPIVTISHAIINNGMEGKGTTHRLQRLHLPLPSPLLPLLQSEHGRLSSSPLDHMGPGTVFCLPPDWDRWLLPKSLTFPVTTRKEQRRETYLS